MKKEIKNRYILSFSKEEIANSRVRTIIRELIELKLNMQKYKDFITISPAEFEIVSKLGDFVPKEKYNSQTTFKGEVGKIKGRKLVVK
jgi:ribosomal protein S19